MWNRKIKDKEKEKSKILKSKKSKNHKIKNIETERDNFFSLEDFVNSEK